MNFFTIVVNLAEKIIELIELSYKSTHNQYLKVISNQERMMKIMSANQDKIDALSAQLDKATGEIKAEIENLKSQAGAEQLDFSALESKVQGLDDLNPDAPTQPSEPTQPEQPSEPSTPAEPSLPEEPNAPVETVPPVEPTPNPESL